MRKALCLLLILLGAAPARAEDRTPAVLADGRYVLVSTWPEGADRVCFVRPGVAGADVCTAAERATTTPGSDGTGAALRVATGEVVLLRSAAGGPTVAYQVVRLDPGVLWVWQAIAENAAGRSAPSAATFVVDLRGKPAAAELLRALRAQAADQVRRIDELGTLLGIPPP